MSTKSCQTLRLPILMLLFSSLGIAHTGAGSFLPILQNHCLSHESLSSFSSSRNNTDAPSHTYTARGLTPRYSGPDKLTDEQASIRDDILQSRPRTGLSGPFGPWLAIPAIAGPAQSLGWACRYGTSLSFRESELVILLTGAKTKSHAEFDIHVDEAIKSGLSMSLIQSIPRDDDFSLAAVIDKVVPRLLGEDDLPDVREQAIAKFTAELLETQTVSEETYQQTKELVGGQDSVLVEITSIIGYYTYVAYTLNVFRIPSS